MPKVSAFASPLRYPGGKAKFSDLLAEVRRRNRLGGCAYAEPFAGGAGAALSLLYAEHVPYILINDYDPHLGALWRSVLDRTDDFVKLMRSTRPSIVEWRRQRSIYQNREKYGDLRVGFATFFLNRCNHSGVIASGGPIGGIRQLGDWSIDARWNVDEQERRIRRVAAYRDRIEFFQLDALEFLRVLSRRPASVFVYLDPPYYKKGPLLYPKRFEHDDHEKLAVYLRRTQRFKWLASYDNVSEIKRMYQGMDFQSFDLAYTAARERSTGNELLIHQPGLDVPCEISSWIQA